MNLHRRQLLATTALFLLGERPLRAEIVHGTLPWQPDASNPPDRVLPGPWHYFTLAEAAAVEALADRIIPPDPEYVGGKGAGCAVFIDRQLAGPYGRQEGLYIRPPFMHGTKQQGSQGADGPAVMYRKALAALDRACRARHDGKVFAALADGDMDATIAGLEKGEIALEGVEGKHFFEVLLKDVKEGFFADPIYGGNRDMVAWKMIGYPGARYDYRDWVSHHNERFPLPPVSITGRPEWSPH